MNRSAHKILFVGEAVTLAHVARPFVLATHAASAGYETVLYCDPRYASLFEAPDFRQAGLTSIPSRVFLDRLSRGEPLYDARTLEEYVADDLRVIERERPDAVVGDFRLSLSVSARLAGIPYLAVANAHWSPFARIDFPIPAHPLVGMLGPALAQRLFDIFRPIAFALHARPLNRVRKRYGLKGLGNRLQTVYTDADQVLYADLPQLVPTPALPDHHRFIGPVLWSAKQALPDWWQRVDDARPLIYLNPGSSGSGERLPSWVDALLELPVSLMVATAGGPLLDLRSERLFQAPYIPGDAATARAKLVISNGGSMTGYEAIRHGVPVLGVAGNLDQHLNADALERIGVGLRIRSDGASPRAIVEAAVRLLGESCFRQSATAATAWLEPFAGGQRFITALDETVGG
jgi:UDP:flavonoid glycosyltransferase YjiC (YdhE family)